MEENLPKKRIYYSGKKAHKDAPKKHVEPGEPVVEKAHKEDVVEIPIGKYIDKARQNPWVISTFVLGIFLLAVLIFNVGGGDGGITGNVVSEDTVGDNLISFVESRTGETPEVLSVEKDGMFYIVTLSLQGQEVPVYMTVDGEYLLPGEPLPLTGDIPSTPDEEGTDEAQTPPPAPTVVKSDKPKVEAFVMSHCPFGTQIEKGLLPVVELLGDKIDFELKFVNYAMHGEVEVTEQTKQYCIQKEQNDKFLPYLKCFLEDGDTERCLTEIEIDTTKLDACVAAADTEFDITKNLDDKESWSGGRFPKVMIHNDENLEYGVQGSPTLVINGEKASSGRDSASLLRAVCGAFNEAPEECSETLSSASPSSGFGFGTSAPASGGTPATCG